MVWSKSDVWRYNISNIITRKLDSLKIIGNVMVVEKDSLSNEGFNQIKGGILNGMFSESKLKDVEIKKNIDVIYYMYSDENNELIGINNLHYFLIIWKNQNFFFITKSLQYHSCKSI